MKKRSNKPQQHFIMLAIFVLCQLQLLHQTGLAQNGKKEISAEEYIAIYKDWAIKEMKIYRIPASITLAQGMLESSNGNSDLAIHANNHFGIKCHLDWDGRGYYKDDDHKNECFRVYDNAYESFRDHSIFLKERSRYAFLFELDPADYKGWAHGLKQAGYATEPAYAYRLIQLIEKNQLYLYDQIFDTSILVAYQEPPDQPEYKVSGKIVKMNENDFDAVNIGTGIRKIAQNNGVNYIIARKGDSPEQIAHDLEMMSWEIRKYNDLTRHDPLLDGQIIYIQPKKNKAVNESYVVQDKDTMHSISQMFAVKLNQLYKKNGMIIGSEPLAGQRLRLK